ncbi:MAG TPA: HAD family hydrolase [Firmicutes bacterium]|nr:HAD family hydrolase [Bacillota bacterium]HBX25701.1 HAD family hydrolase [Bacillota bacterium]
MKKNLIFDLDGTLWDATKQIAAAWENEGKAFFGLSYSISVLKVKEEMGKTMDVIAKDISPSNINELDIAKFGKACFEAENAYLSVHPGKLYDKEIETLKKLKTIGFDLFIVSNCQKGYIENYLKIIDPCIFKSYLCYGDTNASKDVTIKKLMDKFDLEDAIYIGDTYKDEESSHKAGIKFIHASYGFGKSLNPEGVIASFPELIEVALNLYKIYYK